MAKIQLKFNAAVLREIELLKDMTTFGRKPGNDVIIENPAVSGFHGRIVKEGAQFYIEDLNSTNGTYLNGQRVKRAPIKNHDQISIARHVIEFITDVTAPKTGEQLALLSSAKLQPTEPAAPPPKPPEAVPPEPVEVPVTPEENPSPLIKESVEPAVSPEIPPLSSVPEKQPEPVMEPAPIKLPKLGILRFISGADATSEVVLKDLVTYVGSADQAVIKLKGFMVPSLAAAISKRPEGYFLKAIKPNYPKVNGAPIKEQILLEPGALLEFGGLAMVFQYKESEHPSAGD